MTELKLCPFCDARKPRKLRNDKVGHYPMGKPLAINDDGHIVVYHCPKCGRKLP